MDDRKTRRGLSDEAGVGPEPKSAVNLVALKDLDDYKVADGEPDIRGWPVLTATGRELGDVEDLLVDTDTNEVVMLDVDLKRDDRHTLAPIKAAWLDRGNRRVVLNTSMFDVDDDIPALRKARADEPVETESVRRFNERYERAYGDDGWDRDREIRVRRANDDLRISRSVPPPPSELSGRPDPRVETVRSSADRVEDRLDPTRDASAAARTRESVRERLEDPTDDRASARVSDRLAGDDRPVDLRSAPLADAPRDRRVVRYGQSRQGAVVEEVVVRRRVVDPSELSPAETERLRQEQGDLTRDARDTLSNRPPTEERR